MDHPTLQLLLHTLLSDNEKKKMAIAYIYKVHMYISFPFGMWLA